MNIEQARFNMIEQQIRPWDVLDQQVLSVLSTVQRENFVPPAYRHLAFSDTEIPLGDGQCMLAPKLEARLLQELGLAKTDRVLEIGAGSGFMAALIGHLAAEVISLEIRPSLAHMAQQNLQAAGIQNVRIMKADGSQALQLAELQNQTFDAIVLSGSVAQIPAELGSLLKPGGRLVAIVGHEPMMRALRITATPAGLSQPEYLFDTCTLRLDGFAVPSTFTF
jgi:protein-L-isoaspartate(D-aspartate) O-methyltransferase